MLPDGNMDTHKYLHGAPYRLGAELMTKVRWFELNQQQRSIDPNHTEMVNHTYRGRPITVAKLRSIYKILSSEDAAKQEWLEASLLVATNRERYTFTHSRAKEYAKFHHRVVIRWVREYKDWQQKPPDEFEGEAMQDPCFYEYFVAGADGFLTESIQRDLGLVNATSLRMHSICFDDEIQRMLKECEKSCRAGEVITAPRPPLCVMVEVFPGSNTPEDVMKALRDLSISASLGEDAETKIIVPLYRYSCKWDHTSTPVYGKYPYFRPSRITLKRHFPFELAFAVTVHKAEGRTIHRIIIGLSYCRVDKCNFSFAQFHVAMTRVKESSHIRFLLTGATEDDCWKSIQYLEKLRPDPSIEFFFAGFRDIENLCNPNINWVENEWSADRANAVFKNRFGIKHN